VAVLLAVLLKLLVLMVQWAHLVLVEQAGVEAEAAEMALAVLVETAL